MANPYVGGISTTAGQNIGSAGNLDNFYGYGSKFVDSNQFVLDMKENISLFGADASPFYSWSSMVRKNPTHNIEFSWMEDELFLHRDINAQIKRTVMNTTGCVWTLRLLDGGSWQAFEAAPLADAIAQAVRADEAAVLAAGGPSIFATIRYTATPANVHSFIPTAYGLAIGPTARSVTFTGSAQSMVMQNELLICDYSAATGGGIVGQALNNTNANLNEIYSYCANAATTATLNAKLTTHASLNLLVASSGVATATPFEVTVHVTTPNEYFKGFAQGSGLPSESRKKIRSFKNYVQIFKTPYSIANTLKSIQLYGGPELAKMRYRKAIQHKIDIERAILFQRGGLEGTDWGVIGGNTYENPLTRFKGLGIGSTSLATAGCIVTKNGGWDSAFQFAPATATMSTLNGLTRRLFEDTVDQPSSTKLVFASKKWMGALSEMAYAQNASAVTPFNLGQYRWGNIAQKDGRLGVKIRSLETPYGDLNFVDMPHFRGEFENYALVVDMNHMEIRPLRDTTLHANCGDGTIDGQIDYYLTEVGFECRHESAHAILKLV